MNINSRGPTTGAVFAPGPIGRLALLAAVFAATTVACTKDTPSNIGWPGTAVTGFPTCTISGLTSVGPGPGVAANAQLDLTVAYNQLDAKACDATLSADLGGLLGGK